MLEERPAGEAQLADLRPPAMAFGRKYELKQRANEMAATRRRITEAAVELHETVGPARAPR